MTSRTPLNLLALICLALAISALAHDPKEHAREAAAAKAGPDCVKLQSMDLSQMDANDPVLLALQAKCAGSMPAKHTDDDGHADSAPAPDEKSSNDAADKHGGA